MNGWFYQCIFIEWFDVSFFLNSIIVFVLRIRLCFFVIKVFLVCKKRGGIYFGIFFFFFWIFFSFFGPLVPWSSNPLVPWSSRPPSSRPLIVWSPVAWSPGPLVLWSSGPLLLWSSGPRVLCSFSFLFF